MSRQFRFYLLPAEIEAIISELQEKVGLRLIAARSSTPTPAEIGSALYTVTKDTGESLVHVHCYLAPLFPAPLWTVHAPRMADWFIDQERSEVIQFSGCGFDGKELRIGRFYFQTDFLNDTADALIPHRAAFLDWGDRIFRNAKRQMKYSSDLAAYIGREAEVWRQQGGKFKDF